MTLCNDARGSERMFIIREPTHPVGFSFARSTL